MCQAIRQTVVGWREFALVEMFGGPLAFDVSAPALGFQHAGFYFAGARTGLTALFLEGLFAAGLFFASAVVQRLQETFAGKLAVLKLGAGVLDGDEDASRQVAQGDFGGGFVDVLPARARRAIKAFFEFSVVELSEGHVEAGSASAYFGACKRATVGCSKRVGSAAEKEAGGTGEKGVMSKRD